MEHTLDRQLAVQSGSQTYEFDWTPPATAVGQHHDLRRRQCRQWQRQRDRRPHLHRQLHPDARGGGHGAHDRRGRRRERRQLPAGHRARLLAHDQGHQSLAGRADTWDKAIVNGKLPTSLDGVSVSVAGKPAYVYFISPGQINVQAPDVGAGPVPVTVTTPSGTSAAVTATVCAQAPAFFLWPRKPGGGHSQLGCEPGRQERHLRRSHHGRRQARRRADPLGHRLRPHHPGGRRRAYRCPRTRSTTASAVTVKIGSADAQVFGAALAPGFAGLYQVAIQVPASMADGDYRAQGDSVGSLLAGRRDSLGEEVARYHS